MAFVYRYIDLEAQAVVYIGKVTNGNDDDKLPLVRRHEQHMREDWYKKNANNLVMQFITVESHADADMLETWLISQYSTGQLINAAKTSWGRSRFDLWGWTFGRWRTFHRGNGNRDALIAAAERLYKTTDGLSFDVEPSLDVFCDMVREIVREQEKANRLSRYDEQNDFLRLTRQEGKQP